MTPSEAFLAWIDGKRVQVELRGDWCDVRRFIAQTTMNVVASNGIDEIIAMAHHYRFRLADAPTEPKPTVEDSEAWGLLRDIRDAVKCHGALSGEFSSAYAAANNALKKRGML